jgi:hypothetical protein
MEGCGAAYATFDDDHGQCAKSPELFSSGEQHQRARYGPLDQQPDEGSLLGSRIRAKSTSTCA